MHTINTLDFLYIVLAIGLIPTFILLCMLLWRMYKMMDKLEMVLDSTEQTIHFVRNIDRLPAVLTKKFISGFYNFFK